MFGIITWRPDGDVFYGTCDCCHAIIAVRNGGVELVSRKQYHRCGPEESWPKTRREQLTAWLQESRRAAQECADEVVRCEQALKQL